MKGNNAKRYTLLDVLRGIAVIAMVVYHTLWDLVYVHNVDIPWFVSVWGSVFQASIRWSFIIISGFSWSLGRKRLRRALTVFAGGIVISLVTMIIMPNDRIIFGILTFLGSAMLFMIPLDKLFKKVPPIAGMILSLILFSLTYNVSSGTVGLGSITFFSLPSWLYANYITAFLGFFFPGFESSDYVPLIPWLFLFWAGYFLYRLFEKRKWMNALSSVSIKPIEWIGRHALIIYMLHQPVVYGVLYLIFYKKG